MNNQRFVVILCNEYKPMKHSIFFLLLLITGVMACKKHKPQVVPAVIQTNPSDTTKVTEPDTVYHSYMGTTDYNHVNGVNHAEDTSYSYPDSIFVKVIKKDSLIYFRWHSTEDKFKLLKNNYYYQPSSQWSYRYYTYSDTVVKMYNVNGSPGGPGTSWSFKGYRK